jgi:putative FmdB family regulatory protein
MPIYEFYCADCHVVFSFFARTQDLSKRPSCPRCHRPDLERRVSRFAVSKGRSDTPASQQDEMPGVDEAKMERMMEELARDAEHVDENNPRQMAHMLRRLYEGSGMPADARFDEAIRRMEAGESPEKIEEEMGDLFGEDTPTADAPASGVRRLARRLRPPEVDETLYDL